MKKSSLVSVFFATLFILSVFLYFFRPLGENFYIIGDLIVIFLSFLAFLFCLHAYKFYGLKSLQGKAFLAISVGIFFWFLGETTWGIYEIVLGVEAPIGSLADAFWLNFLRLLFFLA